MTDNNKNGVPVLYVLGTPISSDYKDLSPSAIDTIKNVNLVIGEERKNVLRILAGADARDKEYLLLNEHSESEDKAEVMEAIKNAGSAVLFSDAGTPAVADPGYDLINLCYEAGICVKSTPGPSSITAALSVSGFFSERFYFAGFPPRDERERKSFFQEISNNKSTTVVLERPYVLQKTLEELGSFNRKIVLAVNLGFEDEEVYRGTADEILKSVPEKMKKPFVIVMDRVAEKKSLKPKPQPRTRRRRR